MRCVLRSDAMKARRSASDDGLGRPTEAAALEAAVDAALASAPTPDLGGAASTAQFGDAVLRELGTSPTV